MIRLQAAADLIFEELSKARQDLELAAAAARAATRDETGRECDG